MVYTGLFVLLSIISLHQGRSHSHKPHIFRSNFLGKVWFDNGRWHTTVCQPFTWHICHVYKGIMVFWLHAGYFWAKCISKFSVRNVARALLFLGTHIASFASCKQSPHSHIKRQGASLFLGTHKALIRELQTESSFAHCNQRRERLESVRGRGLYCSRVFSGGGKASNLTDRALRAKPPQKVFFGGRRNRGRFTVYLFMLCDLLLEIL